MNVAGRWCVTVDLDLRSEARAAIVPSTPSISFVGLID